MCHTGLVRSGDIVKALRARGLTQEELARRVGVARETLSRWESGAQQPSFESLARLATAAGARLDVRLEPAEPGLIALVEDQLELAPLQRLKSLLLEGWPACRKALSVAAQLGEPTLLIGPAAAALSGAPQRPLDARVDLLVYYADLEQVHARLFDLGGWPDGVEETESGERRGRWRVGRAKLGVRTCASGIDDIPALLARSRQVALDRSDGARHLRVASVTDLLRVAERSPWNEDAIYRTGLRAVLASKRYWLAESAARDRAAA